MVAPFVTRCLNKAKEHRWSTDDILTLVMDRKLQLFVVEDWDKLVSVVLTEVLVYPRCKELGVFMWCGEFHEDWLGHTEQLAQWAKAMGCSTMSSMARRGFSRAMPNYWDERQTYVVRVL
jgi:hypothetical protein